MIDMALRARLPLIGVVTRDVINAPQIIEFHDPESCVHLKDPGLNAQALAKYAGKTLVTVAPRKPDYAHLYNRMIEAGSSLVVVNPHDVSLMFDAGPLRVPTPMLREWLQLIAVEAHVEGLIYALAGLDLVDVGNVCRIASSHHGALTPSTVMETRRAVVRTGSGVAQVDTALSFYQPPDWLEEWLEVDGRLFNRAATPFSLVPRGMLFDGDPGTGKTMGARYIANRLSLPLYRIDLGAIMGKYVGESESNLSRVLAEVDAFEPCVALIDEVEKVFERGGEDTGVTSRLLSAILWWLQEHRSRVLTLLTTNDRTRLPAELYRPGRIDHVWVFEGLSLDDARDFAREVGHTLPVDLDDHSLVQAATEAFPDPEGQLSHAEITQAVYDTAKRKLAKEDSHEP